MNFKFPACYYHFVVLIWLCSVFLIGIWNFKMGFLLSRTVVGNISSCDDFSNSLSFKPLLNALPENLKSQYETFSKSECWAGGRFQKAVVLLIDGLRFDFAYSSRNKVDKNDLPYINKMNVFWNAILKTPQNSFFAPFIADPPTTTLQRLQGLTTGTLPTFIDFSNNFGSEAIQEDSIIRQATQNGKKVVFLGDDTWQDLFPGHFHRSHFYPSFNVKDLDTVDNGIMDHLPNELQLKDWDIIIAHFLGVDHCGHRYGPLHPEMGIKLTQINLIIKEVMRNLPSDTILFVLGDHGMTSSGDHGGDSPEEISSAFFVYSKEKVQTATIDLDNLIPMAQVNFIPTFSLLLGLPIPFSSLGTIVPELFLSSSTSKEHSIVNATVQDNVISTMAVIANAWQVHRYLKTVKTLSSDFESIEFDKLETSWITIQNFQNKIIQEKNGDFILEGLAKLKNSYLNYLDKARQACLLKWAVFNVLLMSVGIFIFFLSVLVLGILLYKTSNCQIKIDDLFFWIIYTPVSVLPFIFLSTSLGYSFSGFYILDALNTVAIGTLFTVLFKLLKRNSILLENECSQPRSNLESIFTLFCLFSHFGTFFSNSFVIQEDKISAFMVQSLFLIFIAKNFVNVLKSKSKQTFKHFKLLLVTLCPIFLALLRAGEFFHKCREEHGPSCTSSLLIVNIQGIPENFFSYRNSRLFVSLLVVSVLMIAFVYLMRRLKKMFIDDLSAVFIEYATPFIIVCIAANWILGLAPKKTLDKLLHKKQEVPAQAAAILSVFSVALLMFFPISVNVDPSIPRPKWARFHLTMLINNGLIFVSFILLSFLFAGDGLALSVATILIASTIWCALWVLLNTLDKSENGISYFSFAAMLSALSSHSFFATGHQAVFSAIHWNSAFVISSGESIGRILPATTVLFETFCLQVMFIILLHAAVPLMEFCRSLNNEQSILNPENILSSSVRGILPSLKKTSNNTNVGYLSRYENSLLKLQLSYLFCQAIKLFGAIIASFILRRHLMVWKIFAPRVIFEVCSFCVTVVTMVVSQLFTTRYFYKLES